MTPNEERVLKAVAVLNADRRTTNNSQLSAETGLPRTVVAGVAASLRAGGYITDVSKGSAYRWRITTKGRQYQP